MKIIKNICLSTHTVLILFLSGCSNDFLTEKNTQGVTQDALFKKEEDGVRLVNSIYDTFHDLDFMLKALWYQANFLSQDFKNYGADVFFTTYEIPTTFDPLRVFWSRSYQGIARANSAITIIADMKKNGVLNEQLANRLTGEALFLRGIFYYYLGSNFGGVPLELQTVVDGGIHPRNTQNEVFVAVANDMQAAANLLSWQQDLPAADIGRATKGAALAYLGDAQMWLKKYPEAIAAYNQLEGKYVLENNFLDIHSFNNQNGKESIFEVQFIALDDRNMSWGRPNDTHWISTFGMPQEVSDFGYAYADKLLYDSFEPGDKRKAATVIGPGDVHPDSTVIKISSYPNVIAKFPGMNTCGTKDKPWKGNDGARSGYYGIKNWRDPKAIGSGSGAVVPVPYIFSGQNQIFMRYGQVLLSKAEALHRTGNDGGALDIINNQIRKRAGLDLATGGNVLSTILKEYRHELAGEFSLWYMLRRSGEHIKYVKDTYNIDIPFGKDLMPIPQREIGINEKLRQNPGY